MTLDELLATDRAVITRTEVASLLECDERTVSNAIAAGGLPSVRVGRRVLIPVRRLIPLLTNVPTPTDEPGALTPGHVTAEPAVEEQAHDDDARTDPGLRGVA